MSHLVYECAGVEPVGRGGFGDRLEPRHGAADARHAAAADRAARRRPAREQVGHGGVERGNVGCCRHGRIVARRAPAVVALAQAPGSGG
jgi:hypothetical protein